MKTLAVCIYSFKDGRIITDIRRLFSEYSVTVICDMSNDVAQSIYNVSLMKRDREILNKADFDICMAINGSCSLDEYMRISTEPSLNTIYFSSGILHYRSISINFDMFYGKSSSFDRACEFNLNLKNIQLDRLYKSSTLGDKFYFHLKSLNLNPRCINHENSDLLVGSA